MPIRSGFDFDSKGSIALSGNVIPDLFEKWNAYKFYKLDWTEKFGKRWFVENFNKDIYNSEFEIKHLLRTATEHISKIISDFIISKSSHKSYKVLVTGGGAHNDFLIKQLKEKSGESIEYIIPDSNLIDFKKH
ncbi:MAG: anhydro-N-acetylmuramic acid kinase [Saprospiraceae bacterium]|nr:anhydro-N-acetylmuramic acid kinase [Saprospiraceae bacterium]